MRERMTEESIESLAPSVGKFDDNFPPVSKLGFTLHELLAREIVDPSDRRSMGNLRETGHFAECKLRAIVSRDIQGKQDVERGLTDDPGAEDFSSSLAKSER